MQVAASVLRARRRLPADTGRLLPLLRLVLEAVAQPPGLAAVAARPFMQGVEVEAAAHT